MLAREFTTWGLWIVQNLPGIENFSVPYCRQVASKLELFFLEQVYFHKFTVNTRQTEYSKENIFRPLDYEIWRHNMVRKVS